MCGRFTLRSDGNALAQHFGIEPVPAESSRPRFNIAPTQRVNAIRLNPDSGQREMIGMRWGLVPHWARDAKPLPSLFNARAETASSKPAFRAAFQARRCLIPADGFYEWRTEGKRRQPWFVHRRGHAVFAFAGLWEDDTCTILTSTPIPLLASLHNRMPVIPRSEQYDAWLDPAPRAAGERLATLVPPNDLELYPVSPLVNRAGIDKPECVAPLDET